MIERKYTVDEIEDMRRQIFWSLAPTRIVDGVEVVEYWSDSPPPVAPSAIEDRLRTYMMAGLGPEDLRQASAPHSAVDPRNRVREILREFGKGCANAGGGHYGRRSDNPADCEPCFEAAVDAIMSWRSKTKRTR